MRSDVEMKWAIFQELNRRGTALRPGDSYASYQMNQSFAAQSGPSLATILGEVETVFAALTAAPKAKRRK